MSRQRGIASGWLILIAISLTAGAKLQENESATNGIINSLRAGARKLYIDAKCPDTGGDAVSGATAGSGGGDGPARAELHGPDAEFLLALASEADAVTRQLAVPGNRRV
jgi:hypothetical protein